MKAPVGFIFFMLFLAGLLFVNLKGMQGQSDSVITAAAEIAATAWRPTHIGEMRLADDSGMTIQFSSFENVAGHSGCNDFFGHYSLVDGHFEFGPLSITRMACPEPANSFEISFMDALQASRTLTRTDTRLVMRDDKDVIVARFIAIDGDDTPR
jgi:heat shock protein HslJ